jgi:hypothetical protein
VLPSGDIWPAPPRTVHAQKVLTYDLDIGHMVKRVGLDGAADRKGSFLNDIAVDEARKVASFPTVVAMRPAQASSLSTWPPEAPGGY